MKQNFFVFEIIKFRLETQVFVNFFARNLSRAKNLNFHAPNLGILDDLTGGF